MVVPRAGAGCRTSSARPPGRCGAPSAACRRSAAGRARPTWRPASRSAATRPSGPSATSSCTAPTPRPKPSSRSTACSSSTTCCPPRSRRSSASTPPSSTGPVTATTSTCLPSWPTPGCAWPGRGANARALRRPQPRRTGQAGGARRPTASWPCSTWRTPWWRPTSSTPTPGWPPGTWACPSVPVSRLRTLLEAPRMLSLDMVDRGDFLRWFYRRYENADLGELQGKPGS